jgi:hypothetical protein
VNRTRRLAALVTVSAIALVGAFATPAFAASNRQIAKASTLKVSDLSEAGWTATPHTEDPPSKIPACAPTNKVERVGKRFSAHSPDFKNSDTGGQITNTVYVFPTVKLARAYLAAFKLPTAQECLQQGLDQNLEGSGATATVSPLDVSGAPPGTFDDGVGYQGVVTGIPADQGGGTDVYFEAVAFRVGRAVTGLTTTNPGAAYPGSADLVFTTVARLKKNLK